MRPGMGPERGSGKAGDAFSWDVSGNHHRTIASWLLRAFGEVPGTWDFRVWGTNTKLQNHRTARALGDVSSMMTFDDMLIQ